MDNQNKVRSKGPSRDCVTVKIISIFTYIERAFLLELRAGE